ncbi:MAG: hypothetical protein CNLJKLNK_01245 [Holosporales bacterium]
MIIFSLYAHGTDIHMCLVKSGCLVRSEKFILEQKKISTALADCVQAFLMDDIPCVIAIHKGPTSFTTLRVCLSYVQGLAVGYNAKIFAPSHFELIQKAFNVQNGEISINHNGSAYPGVFVVDGQITEIESFSYVTPYDFATKNMAEELVRIFDDQRTISAISLEPEYGLLPTYTPIKK